jgi:hypothetical protein
MQYTEIIKLLDAGYTRDEIIAMKEKPDETKPDETKPDETKPDETKPDETGMSELVKEMRDAFSEMKKEFTAFNIMSSRQPEEKKPEDIIANIINPTRKKKGE